MSSQQTTPPRVEGTQQGAGEDCGGHLPSLDDNDSWAKFMREQRSKYRRAGNASDRPSAQAPPRRGKQLSDEQQARLRASLYKDSRGFWHDERGRLASMSVLELAGLVDSLAD
uniref:Uncharacterized protein n=1 Tax=Neobodo designis TaxID=312471 RepID=A0A7S1Q2U5_NEODS|mmetsp:Transcript_29455/g.90987  ORF Transcript_29455/g.90987 Transcript_29455/m.90987 type:complete len:113 (+) Transcript_29455:55-393(+)